MGFDQFKSCCSTYCEVTPSCVPTEMGSVGAACYQITHPHVPKRELAYRSCAGSGTVDVSLFLPFLLEEA